MLQVKILVDDSPPETGYVFDGPAGSPDRDYQSQSLIEWHWTGFYDHESGISKYHYAVGAECFSKEELRFVGDNSSAYAMGETQQTTMSLNTSELGVHRMTVIAFNGAMEPSDAVCSSGVVYDVTPPQVREVRLLGAKFTPSIVCDLENDTMYIVTVDGEIMELSQTDACLATCTNTSSVDVHRFPVGRLDNGTLTPQIDYTESDVLCHNLLLFDPMNPIFVSSDNIDMTWQFVENESQMLDYLVGLSSTSQVDGEPDVVGFTSAHNKTRFKCYHCGLGQGDEVFVNIKAVNKASLEDHFIFGPVVVDFTPPVYYGGIDVNVQNDTVDVTWQLDAFLDNEDERPLSQYMWSISKLTGNRC